MLLTGAQITIETLIEQGCKVLFGYPGGQVIDLYDALYEREDRIKHVLTAHEQGACHAADGYARASGQVGVVLATSGPGATNLVTGIATAYLDSIPLVAITGNVPNSLIGRDSFQEVDITGITLPITKHNFIVKNIEDLRIRFVKLSKLQNQEGRAQYSSIFQKMFNKADLNIHHMMWSKKLNKDRPRNIKLKKQPRCLWKQTDHIFMWEVEPLQPMRLKKSFSLPIRSMRL